MQKMGVVSCREKVQKDLKKLYELPKMLCFKYNYKKKTTTTNIHT